MHGNVFEYAVIRVVPRAEREEFINVGVILYCRDQKFLEARCALQNERLIALFPSIDPDEMHRYLNSFHLICAGKKEGGPIGELDMASRFRWLTASRSTILRTSPVHPGLTLDARSTLEKLFEQQVG
jgi:hypothetical protein